MSTFKIGERVQVESNVDYSPVIGRNRVYLVMEVSSTDMCRLIHDGKTAWFYDWQLRKVPDVEDIK